MYFIIYNFYLYLLLYSQLVYFIRNTFYFILYMEGGDRQTEEDLRNKLHGEGTTYIHTTLNTQPMDIAITRLN